jgi:SSS family solute:Na+ symporter
MAKMKANIGDPICITDNRKWFGGLKSIHSVFSQPHSEDGIVYVTEDHVKQAQFVKDKLLLAENEM